MAFAYRDKVYPRMYGETRPEAAAPPVRRGSIPACTGKPLVNGPVGGTPAVYPRMYGETTRTFCPQTWSSGLSPHVRGNQPAPWRPQPWQGSIPACTGKPLVVTLPRGQQSVYPRMYGETPSRRHTLTCRYGLSPYVRGNRPGVDPNGRSLGSIPACTGKPRVERQPYRQPQVYPRMYGETSESA